MPTAHRVGKIPENHGKWLFRIRRPAIFRQPAGKIVTVAL
jgi:hypothetical protein